MAANTLRGLQTLRAVAAISVVVFHATSRAGEGWLVGQAGVDVFFVISGFIMWLISEKSPSPADFARERFLRVAPLYWVGTAGMTVGGLLGLFPNLTLEPMHVLTSYLFIPHPSPGGPTWPLLVQGWTLIYEVFFYALFALVLFLPRHRQLAALCGVLLVFAGLGALIRPDGVVLAFYSAPIILEFAAGALIGALWTSNRLSGPLTGWVAVAVGCSLFAWMSFIPVNGERLLVWGTPATLLVYGVCTLERRGVSITTPSLMFLGNASYSIYLFHTFAISIVARLFGERLSLWAESALATVAGVLLGACAYLTIEKPLMRIFKSVRVRTPRTHGAA